MKNSAPFRWKIFFFIFFSFAVSNALAALSPDSPGQTYYRILRAFYNYNGAWATPRPSYILPFYLYTAFQYLSIASAFIDVLCLIPFLLFLARMRFLNPALWQWFFVLRVVLNLTGHAYELKLFISLFFTNTALTLSFLALVILAILPSYIACYLYAFRREEIS